MQRFKFSVIRKNRTLRSKLMNSFDPTFLLIKDDEMFELRRRVARRAAEEMFVRWRHEKDEAERIEREKQKKLAAFREGTLFGTATGDVDALEFGDRRFFPVE